MTMPLSKAWALVRFDPSRSFVNEMLSATVIYCTAVAIGLVAVGAASLAGFPPIDHSTAIEDRTGSTPIPAPGVPSVPHEQPNAREIEMVVSSTAIRPDLEAIAEKSGDQQLIRQPRIGEKVPSHIKAAMLTADVKAKIKKAGVKADLVAVFESWDSLVLLDSSRKIISIIPSEDQGYPSTGSAPPDRDQWRK